MIKPKRLKKGDTVGLITPASPITEQQLEKSVTNLESFGLKVVYTENILAKKGYLAGTDEQRLDDFHKFWADPNIKGVICARGGYGTPRILPYIDYELIRKNPKPFVGYSDITALLQAVYKKTGLICFHGPMGAADHNSYSTNSFVKVLMEPQKEYNLIHPDYKVETINDEAFNPYIINNGIAEGRLFGGNLSLMVTLVGTPYNIDFTGKIVFIEEIGEEPYRIDRMLTQLLLAGNLHKAAGIAIGVFKNCQSKESEGNSLTLKEVLFDRLQLLKIPTIYGLRFGHMVDNAMIPVGIKARLDVEKGMLTLLERAVK
jgi:muramoyltetrapeptide carboxypeptidase